MKKKKTGYQGERQRTPYPGVVYRERDRLGSSGKERVYYIVFKKDGKVFEEKVGRQFADDMTPSRAARIRTERIEGKRLSRKEVREQQEEAKRAEAARWTFDRLWQEYKERKPDLKGIVTDENRYQNHIKPLVGDREPVTITPFDVDRLRITLLKTRKPGTVKNVLELLRRLVNFAAKKHLCPVPSFTIEMPRLNNLRTEDLSPNQLTALLEAIDQDVNVQAGNFMKLVLCTGLRRSELFRLEWRDIDYEKNFICLRDTKSGRDQRIPLNEMAKSILEAHPRTDSPFIFPGRHGGKRVDINKQVTRIKQAAGLPKDFRALHGLRHVYASMLASSGQVELHVLQQLLRHANPQTTLRYAHLRNETLRRASDLAGDLIGQVINGQKVRVVNLEE